MHTFRHQWIRARMCHYLLLHMTTNTTLTYWLSKTNFDSIPAPLYWKGTRKINRKAKYQFNRIFFLRQWHENEYFHDFLSVEEMFSSLAVFLPFSFYLSVSACWSSFILYCLSVRLEICIHRGRRQMTFLTFISPNWWIPNKFIWFSTIETNVMCWMLIAMVSMNQRTAKCLLHLHRVSGIVHLKQFGRKCRWKREGIFDNKK